MFKSGSFNYQYSTLTWEYCTSHVFTIPYSVIIHHATAYRYYINNHAISLTDLNVSAKYTQNLDQLKVRVIACRIYKRTAHSTWIIEWTALCIQWRSCSHLPITISPGFYQDLPRWRYVLRMGFWNPVPSVFSTLWFFRTAVNLVLLLLKCFNFSIVLT